MGWAARNRRAVVMLVAGLCLCAYVKMPSVPREDRYPDAATAVDAMLAGSGHEAAREALRSHLMWIEPATIVRRIAALGYRIDVNERPRDGHWFIPGDLDYYGGFTWSFRRLIVVSELVRNPANGEWFPNRQLDEAVDHEIGHALDADIDGSESAAFVYAWRMDFAEIPVDMTTSYSRNGSFNMFRYFTYSENGDYARARRETFAESYTVLLKGDGSRSAALFRKYFPRTLAVERKALESRYGRLFPPAD